jgi:uncharacterized protein YigE (DUF2233 family)
MSRCLLIFLCLFAAPRVRAEWSLANFHDVAHLPGHAVAWEADVRQGDREVRVTGVSFDAHDAVFRIIDNPPDARKSLADALVETGSFAGSNGNYFKEDYTPVGLQVSAGKPVHGYEKANLLSGILAVRAGEIEMVRPADFLGEAKVTEALQCGPWLVEKGAPIAGLNALRFARRTVVATDAKGHWALIAISPVTLAEAGSLLLLKDLPGSWTVRQALNFDGGPSTTLVALSDSRAVLDIPSFGPVRNYLAITPRAR